MIAPVCEEGGLGVAKAEGGELLEAPAAEGLRGFGAGLVLVFGRPLGLHREMMALVPDASSTTRPRAMPSATRRPSRDRAPGTDADPRDGFFASGCCDIAM